MEEIRTQEHKRLFIDMDGVIANFHAKILDVDGYVQIERMYDGQFFKHLPSYECMVDAMKMFVKKWPEVEVFTLSAAELGDPPGFVRQKNEWLDKFLPEIDEKHRIFPAIGVAKSKYIPGEITKADYLLDDYNKNLDQWSIDGGHPIKVKNNINHRGIGRYGGDVGNIWQGDMVTNLDPASKILRELEVIMGLGRVRPTSFAEFDMEAFKTDDVAIITSNIDMSKFNETAHATLCYDYVNHEKVVCVDFVYSNLDEIDVVNLFEKPATEENVEFAEKLLKQIKESFSVPVRSEGTSLDNMISNANGVATRGMGKSCGSLTHERS